MNKENQCQAAYRQSENLYTGEFALDEAGSTENDWVHLMNFRPDPKATCLRMEQGIPELLAMIVPPDMEIIKVGDSATDQLYIVRQVVACGTGEDIIHQIAQLQK